MKTKNDPRHQSRIIALQKLFELEFHSNDPFDTSDLKAINALDTETPLINELFITELVSGVNENHDQIDNVIKQYTLKRPFGDTTRIDLLILRLAVYEILFSHTKPPVKVVIDESIELAKEFGGEKSSTFINGILGNISELSTND